MKQEIYRIIAWENQKLVSNQVMRADFWGRQKIIKELKAQGYEVHSFPV